MKDLEYSDFAKKFDTAKRRLPLYGQIELTYNCPCDCIHCYCKDEPRKELGGVFWKGVLDQIHAAGGIEITFTGGDPLSHSGFTDIYRYARKKGFLVNIFTSGAAMDEKIFELFRDLPPLNIEITLNSLDDSNYDRITGTKGMLGVVMRNIHEIIKCGLPLVLKCNGLKENKGEILKIKKFTKKLLGKGRFKFDSFIFPGLTGGAGPKTHRLKPQEIAAIENRDSDMSRQRREQLGHQSRWFNPDGLYHCSSWFNHYYIDPDGLLQFCHLSKQFATDLKKEPFKQGFDKFIGVLEVKPKKKSKCWRCELLEYCHRCPARAYLETGDEESHVEYYCRLAAAAKAASDKAGIRK